MDMLALIVPVTVNEPFNRVEYDVSLPQPSSMHQSKDEGVEKEVYLVRSSVTLLPFVVVHCTLESTPVRYIYNSTHGVALVE